MLHHILWKSFFFFSNFLSLKFHHVNIDVTFSMHVLKITAIVHAYTKHCFFKPCQHAFPHQSFENVLYNLMYMYCIYSFFFQLRNFFCIIIADLYRIPEGLVVFILHHAGCMLLSIKSQFLLYDISLLSICPRQRPWKARCRTALWLHSSTWIIWTESFYIMADEYWVIFFKSWCRGVCVC